jgi:hypothetical protein
MSGSLRAAMATKKNIGRVAFSRKDLGVDRTRLAPVHCNRFFGRLTAVGKTLRTHHIQVSGGAAGALASGGLHPARAKGD